MFLRNLYIRCGLTSLFLIFLLGCSTEKDAALNVGYHNMTARYNGYFNARVIMDAALENYRAGALEDYTKILPLDLYPSKEDIPLIQDKYEISLEKCENVIFRHSMPSSQSRNKAEENCRWIDDNWFIIGKIHYTRMEYEKAEEILSFIDESPLYIDQERVHEARIWLAKTYIAQGRFPEAKRVLSRGEIELQAIEDAKSAKKDKPSKRQRKRQRNQARKDRKKGVKKPAPFPKKLKAEYELAMTDYYLAQEDYREAIPHLESAIALTKRKKTRSRYMFILAQINNRLGNGDQASFYFNRVVHSNVSYEMRFQAQINKALSATSGGEELRKELKKMLRDPKNTEFKDQIYFALAEIEKKDGNKDLTIQYYTRSAFYSVKNDRQKGLSYLSLGDIYFNDQDYLKAQKYYDSCIRVLPEEYETYEKIEGKAKGLSDLVYHYETYVFEDSVQRKAQMPPEKLEKYLEQQLKDSKEAERKRKEEEQQRLIAQQNRIRNTTANSRSGSKWYFYNRKVSSSGFNDFRALWGQRSSEDNWRRTNKTSYSSFDSDDPDIQDSTDVVLVKDSLTVEMLMADLPLTPEALDSSNNRLMNSLYMLGIIYKEQLKEYGEAIKYFKKVIDKKIDHPKVLPAMYHLYLMYAKKGSTKGNEYKERILTDYPKSEIAEILRDPEYLQKKMEQEREQLNEYFEALENYRYRRYPQVLTKCDSIIANDSLNQYLYKYYLLKAFAIGKSRPGNSNLIREPLEDLYGLAPGSEEGLQAKVYLDKLNQGLSILKRDTIVDQPSSPFIYDIDTEHYFVLVFPNEAGRINGTEIKISNFNREFFRSSRLSIIKPQMGNNQLIVVRAFAEQEKAIDYRLAFNSTSARPTLGNIPTEFKHFLVNSANFIMLLESGDLSSYLDFYKEKYPQ